MRTVFECEHSRLQAKEGSWTLGEDTLTEIGSTEGEPYLREKLNLEFEARFNSPNHLPVVSLLAFHMHPFNRWLLSSDTSLFTSSFPTHFSTHSGLVPIPAS